MTTRTIALRPMRDLLARLPMLPVTASGEIDFPSADVPLLVNIRENSETTINVILRGISAIGDLLSHSAVPIEDGSISADSVESIGFLLSELLDGAGALMTLSTLCRRETMEWIGPQCSSSASAQ